MSLAKASVEFRNETVSILESEIATFTYELLIWSKYVIFIEKILLKLTTARYLHTYLKFLRSINYKQSERYKKSVSKPLDE